MATVPRLPLIQAQPVTPAQQSQMQQAGRGSGLLDPTRTGTDPGRVASLRQNFMGPFASSLHDELQAFDPRTPAGLFNLATVFVPGGKGGWKGKQPLTPGQQRMMEALNNVHPTKPPPSVVEWLIQAGVNPDKANRIRLYSMKHNRELVSVFPQRGSSAEALASHLGVPRRNPLSFLEGTVRPNKPGPILSGQNAIPSEMYQTDAKLGLAPGELPFWATDKRQKNEAASGMDTTRGLDPTEDLRGYWQNEWNQLSRDQQEILRMIVNTIRRRPPGMGGPGGT